MKVALLAHDRFPIIPPFSGGLESFTWHLARGLRARGIDVVVFAAPGSDPQLGIEELDVEPLVLSDEARNDVSMPPEAQVRETFSYLQVMRAFASRPDIDVAHNNSLHFLPIVMSAAIPQPLLTTLHTPATPWLEPALRLTPAAHTVAVSDSVAQLWSTVTPARVIRNGVDPHEWRPGPGGDALVWSGRIVPEKAPHVAALIAIKAGWRLRIAGPVADRQYFETRLKPLLDENVTYVGHLDTDQLRELAGHSAASLVTPAWEEPYGLVAAEAMACGTPVLAVARGGLSEIVRFPGGLTSQPGASEAETVAAAAAMLPLVVGMDRARVRRYALQNCSLDATVDAYAQLYRELVRA